MRLLNRTGCRKLVPTHGSLTTSNLYPSNLPRPHLSQVIYVRATHFHPAVNMKALLLVSTVHLFYIPLLYFTPGEEQPSLRTKYSPAAVPARLRDVGGRLLST